MTNLKMVGNSGKIYNTTKGKIRIGLTSSISRLLCFTFRRSHIILLDYDYVYPSRDIRRIYKKFKSWNLSDFYIIQTSKSKYSAVCFSPVSFGQYKQILRFSHCDSKFKYYTIKSGIGTMRITKKKEKKTSRLKLVGVIFGYEDKDVLINYRNTVFDLIRKNGGII